MYKNFKQKETKEKDVIITIKRLGINGEGIGYYRKKIIFIPGALPNEVVVAKIIKEYPHYIDAELVRIKEKSPDRVPYPKGVDPAIGGLELAHLSYEKQLEFKRDNVLEALRKYHPRGYNKYKVKLSKIMVKPNSVCLLQIHMNYTIYLSCQRKTKQRKRLNVK
jgi:23S rRNA (uracil1939-C5)-methyltransferase